MVVGLLLVIVMLLLFIYFNVLIVGWMGRAWVWVWVRLVFYIFYAILIL